MIDRVPFAHPDVDVGAVDASSKVIGRIGIYIAGYSTTLTLIRATRISPVPPDGLLQT